MTLGAFIMFSFLMTLPETFYQKKHDSIYSYFSLLFYPQSTNSQSLFTNLQCETFLVSKIYNKLIKQLILLTKVHL